MKTKSLFLFFLGFSYLSFAQSFTTGVVNLSSTPGLAMSVKLDISSNVTMTLVGPSGRWFALGFGAGNMEAETDVVGVHSASTLSSFDAKLIGYAAPVADALQNWTITSNQVVSGVRTIVATRSLDTGDANDYTFSAEEGTLSLIWARGSSNSFTYGYHGGSNRGVVNATFTLVQSTSAPSGSASQSFCSVSTVANLVATGSNIKWYSSPTGGTQLLNTTVLTNGTIYYASQTVSGEESSNRLAVTASVTSNSVNTTSITATSSYTWSNNGQTYTTSGIYIGSNANCVTQVLNLTITPLSANLSLQLFLDGYYIYGSNPASMRAARYINLIESGSANPGANTDVDLITVELRSAANLNVVAYSVSSILQTNGSLQCTFPAAAFGNSYYLVVKHRSSIPLWSANPVTMSGSTTLNFSNNSTNAFTDGSVAPMKTLVSGLYATRLGELNGDGYLDGVDYSTFESNVYSSAYGGLYLLDGDLNGDSYVDASDFAVFNYNSTLGSYEQRP